MPLYEYECDKCGNIEEVVQKFSDAPLEKCNCCSGKLRKLISTNSFLLKGGGWYVTDYGSGSDNSKRKERNHGKSTKSLEEKTTDRKATNNV